MKVIVLDKLVPKGFGAMTIGCLVFIRKELAEVPSKLAHEGDHCRQFKEDWLMPIKYLLFKSKRFQYEVEAYAVSIQHGRTIESCADSLYAKYDLGLSYDDIVKALLMRLDYVKEHS